MVTTLNLYLFLNYNNKKNFAYNENITNNNLDSNNDKNLLKNQEDHNTNEEDELVPELTDSEREFLEKYLFGQWRFSECIAKLDETNNNIYGITYNISDLGIEELKKHIYQWVKYVFSG